MCVLRTMMQGDVIDRCVCVCVCVHAYIGVCAHVYKCGGVCGNGDMQVCYGMCGWRC